MIISALRKSQVFESCIFAGYFLLQQLMNKDSRNAVGKIVPQIYEETQQGKALEEFHIAIISDELTYINFSKECHLHKLTPNNWKTVFNTQKIDLFLCESAWEGCKENHQCWRGRIYKNHRVLFETRKTLFRILKYCEQSGIPTVFWNKEDPTYFGSKSQDFVDTALHFQYIFTTAEECVEMYRQSHSYVGAMMFGFSPQIYNPRNVGEKQQRAVFAGSWFEEHAERCKAESALFDKVIAAGIPLTIYDRQSESGNKKRAFPESYQRYVHAAVSQDKLGKEIKKCRYAININTVTDSDSMFARRVYELMASNVYILTNRSKAMELQLKGRYSNLEDEFPENVEQVCRNNVDYVFQNHTNRHRLIKMMLEIGLQVQIPAITIAVCGLDSMWSLNCDSNIHVEFVSKLEDIDECFQYFVIWDQIEPPPLERMLAHAFYINAEETCGIRISNRYLYQITEDSENKNVLFPICMLEMLQKDVNTKTKKYHV